MCHSYVLLRQVERRGRARERRRVASEERRKINTRRVLINAHLLLECLQTEIEHSQGNQSVVIHAPLALRIRILTAFFQAKCILSKLFFFNLLLYSLQTFDEGETLRWLNEGIKSMWPVCMEKFASKHFFGPMVPRFLNIYKPWFVVCALYSQFFPHRNHVLYMRCLYLIRT